ncbi:MAG: IS1380 family transposase [Elusimicrobiota bacterium]
MKGIKNFQISFVEKAITHHGGLFLMHKFCQKLKLKQLLQSYIHFYSKHIKYQTSELILFILYYIIAGILRVDNTRPLQFNGVFKKLLGVKTFPDPTTIRRFLHHLSSKNIRQIVRVHNLLQQKLFFIRCPQTSVILDIDPTAITVYGKQVQRAKRGYNPKKRGRKCYCLILCFEDNHQEFWLGSLRSGNTNAITFAKHFSKDCVTKLPKSVKRIRFRTDASFYDHKFIEFLDEEGIKYTIEAQKSTRIKELIQTLEYHPYKDGWEISEFIHQPFTFKKSHRFVVKRHPKPKDPEEIAQLELNLTPIKGYFYRVLVTNLTTKPRHIWNFHHQRAKGAELNIKELKSNYPLTKIPTQSYTANIAYLQLLLFAFNIVNWFKRLCLPKKFRYKTLQTIRQDFITIPARLIKIGHSNILKFPVGYPYQKLFNQIMKDIKKLKN